MFTNGYIITCYCITRPHFTIGQKAKVYNQEYWNLFIYRLKKGNLQLIENFFLNDTLQRGKMGGGGLYYYKNKISIPTDISLEKENVENSQTEDSIVYLVNFSTTLLWKINVFCLIKTHNLKFILTLTWTFKKKS